MQLFKRRRKRHDPNNPDDILRSTHEVEPDVPLTPRQRLMQGLTVLGVGVASFLFVVALIIGIQKQEEALRLVKELWETGVSIIVPHAPPSRPAPTPRPAPPTATPVPVQPLPTPGATPPPPPSGALPSEAPTLVSVPDGLFGDHATVTRFNVTGYTPELIQQSVLEFGLPLYAGDGAISWVEPRLTNNIDYVGPPGSCQVALSGINAVEMGYEIFLPSWDPAGADSATVTWWNDNFTQAMLHERNHVELYDHYVSLINEQITAGDDCEDAQATYDSLFEEMNSTNCEFDLNEYGLAPGAELEDCTGWRG